MGDILKKLQMVCEKIGVTETAHTIEEQVDLISESLDKIPASTNIAEALDDLSEVAQNINNEEVYVDKTITANGEYLPAEDEATAYSKVTVNVPVKVNSIVSSSPYDVSADTIGLFSNDTGLFESLPMEPYYVIFITPVKKVKVPHPNYYCTFTPDENYDGFYNGSTRLDDTATGDTVVPGDGKMYKLSTTMAGTTITKSNSNFTFSIT